MLIRIFLFVPFLLPFLYRYRPPAYHHSSLWIAAIICLYVYTFIPLVDHTGGRFRGNAGASDRPWPADGIEYRLMVRALFLHIVVLKALAFAPVFTGSALSGADVVGLGFLCGELLGTLGIVVAHELVHRRSWIDRALAEIMMVTVMYPHFCIEHVAGHHKYVGTARDPATARLGESLYRFFPRSVYGGLISAWELETQRLRESGSGWLTPHNRMLRYAVEVAALLGIVGYFGGLSGLEIFVIQSFFAIFAFETINYVQHYGIERKKLSDGTFEPVTLRHSWDSSFRYSNLLFLNLGRHADHHYSPARGFQTLRAFRPNEVPELPLGFPAMLTLAMVPPLWFRIMNPRVLSWRSAGAPHREIPYARHPINSQKDPDAALRTLRSAYRRGDIDVVVHQLDAAHRHSIALSRWEAWCGLLIVPAIAAAKAADVLWKLPWGWVCAVVLCIATVLARNAAARFTNDRKIVGAALRNVYAWDLLWSNGRVEIRTKDGATCTSPNSDWSSAKLQVLSSGRTAYVALP